MPEIENYAELNALITKESGLPIVTKWLTIGEAIDDDGDKRTFFFSSEGCAEWDELGLTLWHQQYRATQPRSEGDDE